MAETEIPRPPAFLHPGEIFTADEPARVKTVVGSCVAIVLRAPRLGLAAMAHCVLPEAGRPAGELAPGIAWRYVDSTIELLLEVFADRGARRGDLEVKLFGGAARRQGPGPSRATGWAAATSRRPSGRWPRMGCRLRPAIREAAADG